MVVRLWSRKRFAIFASRGMEVSTLDYSKVAIQGLMKLAKENNLLSSICASVYDAKSVLQFNIEEFDVVYSHMLFSMHFTGKDLKFMFQ